MVVRPNTRQKGKQHLIFGHVKETIWFLLLRVEEEDEAMAAMGPSMAMLEETDAEPNQEWKLYNIWKWQNIIRKLIKYFHLYNILNYKEKKGKRMKQKKMLRTSTDILILKRTQKT